MGRWERLSDSMESGVQWQNGVGGLVIVEGHTGCIENRLDQG